MKPKILIVEDEKDLVRLVKYNLEKESKFSVLSAGDAEEGLALLRKSKPDLLILDVMLPQMDGLDLLRLIRKETLIPVMLLTAKRGELDRILGLKLGADDYLCKPFSVGELLARVEALLRRAGSQSAAEGGAVASLGGLRIDFERHEVLVRGKKARLAPKEFAILKLLIEAKGKVLSRDELLRQIWGHAEDVEIDTRTVDQHVARLRRKLGAEAERVATVTNFGYQIKR